MSLSISSVKTMDRKYCYDCIHYDEWCDYEYGGLVNECLKSGNFCFETDRAHECSDYTENE